MKRINALFKHKPHNILSVYFTAGFPELNDTRTIITQLAKAGADMIEIGIPFSDPLADGPTIQESSQIALRNGISLKLIFEQLKGIRNEVNIPLILMGYFNPVYKFGVEKFCQKAAEVGIDGVIIPDLPMQEYVDKYQKVFTDNNLENIFLITPQTSVERVKQIDAISSSFIYLVSASSTTGVRTTVADTQNAYFERVKQMNLKNNLLIGFGISNYETFSNACQYANGAIIGSAFIKALNERKKDLAETIATFVDSIRTKQ